MPAHGPCTSSLKSSLSLSLGIQHFPLCTTEGPGAPRHPTTLHSWALDTSWPSRKLAPSAEEKPTNSSSGSPKKSLHCSCGRQVQTSLVLSVLYLKENISYTRPEAASVSGSRCLLTWTQLNTMPASVPLLARWCIPACLKLLLLVGIKLPENHIIIVEHKIPNYAKSLALEKVIFKVMTY